MKTRTQNSETVFRHGFGRLANSENELPEPGKVAICKKWLSENAKRKRVPQDECINSYGLKHRIEEEVGEYIPNGACIQAAIELGFAYWLGFADWRGEDWINARLYMTVKPRPEDQREKPYGFSKWLFDRDDLYFRGDAAIDPNWPRRATRFIDFWRYLKRFGDDTQEELCRAWKDYCGEDPPRPDLIDDRVIETVYNRECDFIGLGEKYPKAELGTKYLYVLVEIEDEEFESTDGKSILESVRVRYIGQTDDPSGRLTSHVLAPGNIPKVKWVGGLLSAGKQPKMAIFQTVLNEEANLMERAAIYAFQPYETRLDRETGAWPSVDDALLNIHK